MSLNFGLKPGESLLTATDSQHQVLTSVERQLDLFRHGYRLEALTAQALLVEALCLHYLLARRNADSVQFDEDIPRLMEKRQLTMGRIRSLLIRNNALHQPDLGPKLEHYVELRNELSHKLLSRMHQVDLQQCFELGLELIQQMHAYMATIIQRYSPAGQ